MFGAPFQKYTTLMYSAGLAPLLDPLDKWRCTHSTHAEQVGGDKDEHGEWLSARAAAYPPDFNMFIARGLRDARFGSELNSKFDHLPNRNLEIVDAQPPRPRRRLRRRRQGCAPRSSLAPLAASRLHEMLALV